MKLLDSLFFVSNESVRASGYECTITLDPNHITFKGHFPGFPVTPGVVQIQILEELVEEKVGRGNYTLKSVSQCKFLKVIDPVKTNQLNVSYSHVVEGQEVKVRAKFLENEIIVFKFIGIFLKDDLQ